MFNIYIKKRACFFFSPVVPFPLSVRLDKLFFDNLARPESKEAEQLRSEVADNVSVFGLLAGMHTCMYDMHNTDNKSKDMGFGITKIINKTRQIMAK